MKPDDPQPVFVPPRAGKTFDFLGVTHKLTGQQTGSAYYLFPKYIPHAIRNPLETTSRYLFMTVPAGLDQWFDALATARAAGELDDAMFRKLSLDFGLEWLE